MGFILKTKFFLQAAFFYLAFNFLAIISFVFNPNQRLDIALDIITGGIIYVLVIGLPWFFIAKSSLESGHNRLSELRGSLKYLRENNASEEKINHAINLYNQEIDTLDMVMGEFPTRALASFFFNYKKPRYFGSRR